MNEPLKETWVKCPGCKEEYIHEIGPLCSCEEDMQDMLYEMRQAKQISGEVEW